MRLHTIMMVPRSFKLDTVIHSAFPENDFIEGVVKEKSSKDPIDGAAISLSDNKTIAYTNEKGLFQTGVPRSTTLLTASHIDFSPAQVINNSSRLLVSQ